VQRAGDILELVPPGPSGGYKSEVALLFHCISSDIVELPSRCGHSSPIVRFLVALSSQPTLSPLFALHPPAVPQMFRCLGAPSLIQATLVQLLDASENLLSHEPGLIQPHLELLLVQLADVSLFKRHHNQAAAAWSTQQRRKLSFLVALSDLATTQRQAALLLDAVSPFLRPEAVKKVGWRGVESALALLAAKTSVVGGPAVAAAHLPALSGLVSTAPARTTRALLFGALARVAGEAPERRIGEAVAWIQDTGAYSKAEVGGIDFQRRQKAYQRFYDVRLRFWRSKETELTLTGAGRVRQLGARERR